MTKYSLFIALFLMLLISACSSPPTVDDKPIIKNYPIYYDVPPEFTDNEKMQEVMDFYRPFMEDKVIFIDPGHGGEDRHGRGPLGVVEADINLKLSLYLRDFLEQTGAKVLLSRVDDSTVGLKERSEIANATNADIFVSIHHNAVGSDNTYINYTSTYYHATKSDYEHEPCNHDLAKYIQRDMAFAMRNSGGLGSFDGTYSDYWIYPGDGFSVLRNSELPAALVEAGFFTHAFEEKRLGIEEFNKIEAWGVFKGICKYFKAGVPEISFVKYSADAQKNTILTYLVQDEVGIDPESIKVYVNTKPYKHYVYDTKTGYVTLKLFDMAETDLTIRIIAANKNGNHAFPFHHTIVLAKRD